MFGGSRGVSACWGCSCSYYYYYFITRNWLRLATLPYSRLHWKRINIKQRTRKTGSGKKRTIDAERSEENKTTANKWLTANISWLLRPAIRIPGFLRAAAAETPPYDVNALFIVAFMCAVAAMSVYNDTLRRRNTYVLATVSCKGPAGLRRSSRFRQLGLLTYRSSETVDDSWLIRSIDVKNVFLRFSFLSRFLRF